MMHTIVCRPSVPKCACNPRILSPWKLSTNIVTVTSNISATNIAFKLPPNITQAKWVHSSNVLWSPKPPARTSSSKSKSSKSAPKKKPTSRSAKNVFSTNDEENKGKGKGRRSKFINKKKMDRSKGFKKKSTTEPTKKQKPKIITKPEPPKPVEQTEERKDGELIYRKVKKDENEMRLDRWVRSHCPSVPQSLLQRMIRKKLILIEGRAATADERVLSGQEVSFPYVLRKTFKKEEQEPPPLSEDKLKELHSWILFKDDHIIALNKPPGLATQGGSGIQTSVDQFLPYLKFDAPEKPRLVHRLDKDTSGILLLGRTRQATIRLQRMIQLHKKRVFVKTYWALAHSIPKLKHGKVDALLQKMKVGNEEKIVVTTEKGREAKPSVTYYSILQNFGNQFSLMALYPETGRMHQLRVVCADLLKTPIVGDPKYGSDQGEKTLAEFLKNKGTTSIYQTDLQETDKAPKLPLLLHARKVECRHPILNASLKIVAPLPPTFRTLLKCLGLTNYNSLNDTIEMK